MPSGFLESEAGQKEYAKLQIPYPKTLQDELYDKWLHDTSAERLSEYSRHKEKEVTRISRVRAGDSKEYIVYSFSHYRLDKDLDQTHRFRPNVGIYAIPQAEFSVLRTDFGKEERKFREVVNIDKAYFIPFSKEKLDEIKNIGLDLGGKVGYNVTTENGLHVSVTSYNHLRNGNYDELVHFGRIPTEAQRKAWLAQEGGPSADKGRYDEVKMQKDNRAAGIPEKTPTVNEVRSMIEEAAAKDKPKRGRKSSK